MIQLPRNSVYKNKYNLHATPNKSGIENVTLLTLHKLKRFKKI